MLHVRPVDPERMGRNGQLLREGAEALGVRHEPLTRNAGALLSVQLVPGRLPARRQAAMHVSYLPRAVAAGARVRAEVEARRVVFEGGRATGLDCLAARERQSAPVQAPRPAGRRARRRRLRDPGAAPALRASARRAVELGRNLRIHPACWVGARFAEEVRGWDGVMQSYAVGEWEDRGLLLEATFTPLAFGAQWLPGTGVEHQERVLAYDQIASTGVHLSDRSAGRVGLARDGSLRITYRLTDDDARRLVFGIARAAELFYAAGASEVYPQIAGIPTLPKDRIADLEASPPPARRAAPRGLPPDGHGSDGRRPGGGRGRHRRRGPRRRGPLRRGRQPAAELDRRQPDDDHHRDGLTGRPPAAPIACRLSGDGRPEAAVAVEPLLPGRARVPKLRRYGAGDSAAEAVEEAAEAEPAPGPSPRRTAEAVGLVAEGRPLLLHRQVATDGDRRRPRSTPARPRSSACGRCRCRTESAPKSGGLMMLMMIRMTERMPEAGDDRARGHGQADVALRGGQRAPAPIAASTVMNRTMSMKPYEPQAFRVTSAFDRMQVRRRWPSRPNHLKMNMIRIRRIPETPRPSRPG